MPAVLCPSFPHPTSSGFRLHPKHRSRQMNYSATAIRKPLKTAVLRNQRRDYWPTAALRALPGFSPARRREPQR